MTVSTLLALSGVRTATVPRPRRPADADPAAGVRWTPKPDGTLMAAITIGPAQGRMLALVFRRRGQVLRADQGAVIDRRVPRTGWYLLDTPPARWMGLDQDRARARVELEIALGWTRADGAENGSGDPLYERAGQRRTMRALINEHLETAAAPPAASARRSISRAAADG